NQTDSGPVSNTTRRACGARLRITAASSCGSDGHLPRQILCPSCRIEIAVSFMARRGRCTAPWLSSVRCLGPVTIVSPFLILSGDSHPAISEHHRHASVTVAPAITSCSCIGPWPFAARQVAATDVRKPLAFWDLPVGAVQLQPVISGGLG